MAGISIDYPLNFPRDRLLQLGDKLMASGSVVPGFDPPEIGALHVDALTYGIMAEGLEFTVLVDRNIASRVAKVAREKLAHPRDYPTTTAIHLMALAQYLDIVIEPSIAFHELAYTQGNQAAHEELSWFRAGDKANADHWLALAVETTNAIDVGPPDPMGTENLAFPLRRWQRNYILGLKIAEFESTAGHVNHLERLNLLIAWMEKKFHMAGPAVLYAGLYFAPGGQRKGLFKSLKSDNRNRALDGIRTAAWDITHLSEFVSRVNKSDPQQERYLFATADKKLAEIASRMIRSGDYDAFRTTISDWWGTKLSSSVADLLWQKFQNAHSTPNEHRPYFNDKEISDLISDGEAKVLKGNCIGRAD